METQQELEEAQYKERVEKVWKDYSKNGNNNLDKSEAYEFLKETLREQLGTEPNEEDLERNFQIMDESKSGDINKSEALEYIRGFRLGQELKTLLCEGTTSQSDTVSRIASVNQS